MSTLETTAYAVRIDGEIDGARVGPVVSRFATHDALDVASYLDALLLGDDLVLIARGLRGAELASALRALADLHEKRALDESEVVKLTVPRIPALKVA